MREGVNYEEAYGNSNGNYRAGVGHAQARKMQKVNNGLNANHPGGGGQFMDQDNF